MSDSTNVFQLTEITPGGTPAQALEKLNTPIREAQQALNVLAGRINDINTKSAVVRNYVPLASGVVVGDLVYYNCEPGHCRFEPALAALRAIPGSRGESVEAPSARVEGIVISTVTETSGNSTRLMGSILTSGYWKDAAAMQNCLSPSPEAGTYYLSPTVPGKAVQDPGGHLRQPVLSYYGEGEFSFLGHYLAHDNHFHSSLILDRNWRTAQSVAEEYGVEVPSNSQSVDAQYAYAVADDADEHARLGDIDQDITAVFYNGLLFTDKDTLEIKDNILWCYASDAVAAGAVVLFNHYPFAYGNEVVRSITANSDFIQVENYNGSVRLIIGDFVQTSVSRSPVAVAAVSANHLAMTPVVTAVTAGIGTTVTPSSDGSVMVSSSDKIGTPLDAYSLNHNGTHPASDGTNLYIMFPKGREASLIMSLPITGSQPTSVVRAHAWGTLTGTGASFTVKYYWAALPSASDTAALPTVPNDSYTLSFAGSSNGLIYAEELNGVEVQGNGMVYAKLTIDSVPTDDIKLLRLGFKLDAVSGGSSGASDVSIVNVSNAIVNQLVSGETFASFRALKAVNGNLALCKSSVAADCDMCIGVSIEPSEATGSLIRYIVSGIISPSGYTFTPGSPVYVGLNGDLTQVDPGSGSDYKFIQKIGMAITATSVQIDVRPGILKQTT